MRLVQRFVGSSKQHADEGLALQRAQEFAPQAFKNKRHSVMWRSRGLDWRYARGFRDNNSMLSSEKGSTGEDSCLASFAGRGEVAELHPIGSKPRPDANHGTCVRGGSTTMV